MATTTGYVYQINVTPNLDVACVWIGAASNNCELLTVRVSSTDPSNTISLKSNIINVLADAVANHIQVSVQHGNNDADISSVLQKIT